MIPPATYESVRPAVDRAFSAMGEMRKSSNITNRIFEVVNQDIHDCGLFHNSV